MKKFFLVLATILVLGISVYFVLFYSSEKLDQLALAETKKIIAEVERSIAKNNKFPDNVGKLIEEHDLRTNIRFGLYPPIHRRDTTTLELKIVRDKTTESITRSIKGPLSDREIGRFGGN